MQLEHVLDYDVALEPSVPIGPGPHVDRDDGRRADADGLDDAEGGSFASLPG